MQTRETQPSGFQPQASLKANPFAPRSFEVTYPGQDLAASPTNPFPRRPHEVWTADPVVAPKPATNPEVQTEAEPKAERSGWLQFSLYAPGQPPPEPPKLNGIQAKCEACEKEEQIQRVYPYIARQQAGSTAIPAESDTNVQAAPNGGTASGQQSSCNPTPLPRAAFLAQAGTGFSELGLTTLTVSAVTFPEVHLSGGRGPVQPTTAALPNIPSIYVGAGTFIDPGDTVRVIGQEGSRCSTGMYPRRWIITQAGADRIREGEQEHCQDFQYAFDISLARYRDAVNQVASSRRRFANENAAKQHLLSRVGAHPDDWRDIFICLAGKTRVRDSRRQDWHTPHARHSDLDPLCHHVNAIIDGNSLSHVGQHSSSSIIRECGEPRVTIPRSTTPRD